MEIYESVLRNPASFALLFCCIFASGVIQYQRKFIIPEMEKRAMVGFDEEAKACILKAMKEDAVDFDAPLMNKVIDAAMKAEQAYLKAEGILTESGEYADGEYDEDDAFDLMIDELTRALPKKDPYQLTELLEYYIEYHDQYMQDKGLLAWI